VPEPAVPIGSDRGLWRVRFTSQVRASRVSTASQAGPNEVSGLLPHADQMLPSPLGPSDRRVRT
jgi:hypothetical protein